MNLYNKENVKEIENIENNVQNEIIVNSNNIEEGNEK